MPYTIANPPDKIKDMPKHCQEIFIAAFNAAIEQYNGDEGKANAVAYTACKSKYKQDKDGEWVAKESKGVNMKESDMSAEDIRRLLQGALEQQFPTSQLQPIKSGAWVRDVYDTDLVYEQDSQAYRVSYSITDGKVTFGKPVKVVATTVYNPIESLKTKYANIIQESSKRNKAKDAKVKAFISGCSTLLADESPQDAKIEASIKEADLILTWLKEQASFKTEDGVEFPAEAYAYTPDKELPSGWKLRLWEDLEKKVTHAQLGRAAAALSPGGFRGQRVEIPVADLAGVKRKIRAEYRKLDVPDEEIPRWVKEAESRTLLTDFIPLTEAKIGSKGKALITVIKPGFNSSKERYYPAETLARDYKVFEGIKMYADHPTDKEEKERPERSIKDWVATLQNVRPGTDGAIIGEAVVVEPWMQKKLATLRDNSMLKDMGISINAVGSASRSEIEGFKTNFIERIVRARSVDFVTEAGAGGGIQLYEAGVDLDIDFVGLDTLRDRRPDLVKSIESAVRAEISKEVKRTMEIEEKVKELETEKVNLTKERDELKGKITEADKARAKAEAQVIIKEAVGKAELPDAAKERILVQFKEVEKAEGIDVAIKAEGDYLAKITEQGKVKGMGATIPDDALAKKALRESAKRLHPEYTEAQLDTFVAGR